VIGISMLAVLFVIALAIFLVLSICAVLMQLTRGNSSGRHAVAMVLLALIAVPVGLVMFLALVRSNVSMEQQEATLSPPQPLPDLPQIREVPPPAEVPPPVNLPPVPEVPPIRPLNDQNRPAARSRQDNDARVPQVLVRAESFTEQKIVVPEIWQLSNGDLFTARIYPSLVATATPLAIKLADELHSVGSGDSAAPVVPMTIQIAGEQLVEKHRSGLLERFSRQLRTEFPDAAVLVIDGPSGDQRADLDEGTVWVSLRMDDQETRPSWDEGIGQERGRHVCLAQTARGDIVVECEYIDKPWLEDFDAFVSQRPTKRYTIGYSGSLVSSEAEARRLAMKDAVAKSRIKVAPNAFVHVSEQHVVDRFAQRLSRPYGDVWREAVLLDVSPDRMAPLISTVQTSLVKRRTETRSALYGLVVLLGFTTLLCVILDAITQGYFRKPLVVGIAAVVILAVLSGIWFFQARESLPNPIAADVTL
jgi:hypothetical protein